MRTVLIIAFLSLHQIMTAQKGNLLFSTGLSYASFHTNTGIEKESSNLYRVEFTGRNQKEKYKYFFLFGRIAYLHTKGENFSTAIPFEYEFGDIDFKAGIGASSDFFQLENKKKFSVDVAIKLILLPRIELPEAKISARFWSKNRFLRIEIFGEGNPRMGFGYGTGFDLFFNGLF